jgi:hypothetical protein
LKNLLKITSIYLLEFGTCVALLFRLRISVGQFPVCALYCNSTQHKALPVALLYCIEKGLCKIFLIVNAHNRMLGVTPHRNLETTYLKDLDEGGGGGASSRRLLLKFRFIVPSEFRYPIKPK